MAGAAPAYSYPERQPERWGGPRIRVVPGRGPRTQEQAAPSTFVTALKVAAVLVAVLTLVGFARIALAAATVTASMQSQEISSMITEARSTGGNLEVAQSSLSNPARIKAEAGKLDMAAPATTATIDLGADVVATDDAGNLSLTKSMAIASGMQGE